MMPELFNRLQLELDDRAMDRTNPQGRLGYASCPIAIAAIHKSASSIPWAAEDPSSVWRPAFGPGAAIASRDNCDTQSLLMQAQ